MNKYTKPEIEILDFAEVDVIATSGEEPVNTPEKLITWGTMSRNVNSEDVALFR